MGPGITLHFAPSAKLHDSDSFHSIRLIRPRQSIVTSRFPVSMVVSLAGMPWFFTWATSCSSTQDAAIARTLEFVRYMAFTAWQTALFNPLSPNTVYTYRVDTLAPFSGRCQPNKRPPLSSLLPRAFWNEPNHTSCNYPYCVTKNAAYRDRRLKGFHWRGTGKVRMRGIFKRPEWLGRRLLPPCGRFSQL